MAVDLRCRSRVLLVGFLALASSCRSVPNVGPFVEASLALHVVVTLVGTELEGQFAEDAQRKQFQEAWARRVGAMKAIADYASGLAQVVEAGRTGADAAAQVLGDCKQLLDTVGAAFPGAGAATEIVSKAVIKAYGLFSEDRAAASVAQAIEYASLAVNELATALAEDMVVLETSVTDWRTGMVTDIKAEAKTRGGALLESLREEGRKRRLAAATASGVSEREALIKEAAQFETLMRQEMSADWHAAMVADLERVQKQATARREVIRAVAATTLAWKSAHSDLARASRTGMTPNYVVLVQFTRDLLEAYAEVKRP